ncbi:hypothetical protein EXIGLDRAFT_91527 [Exidia glandulosa HHB12029]|uniref:Uncharacterized protein n=1 Tax=Exidia glandulosa HHB12029 TaxID=1314781 RepID=A0A165HBF9_EXIGL|nr:hypothetical protein EXIGLDRAFT_91527 [Exidia glandulosa HHB12029]
MYLVPPHLVPAVVAIPLPRPQQHLTLQNVRASHWQRKARHLRLRRNSWVTPSLSVLQPLRVSLLAPPVSSSSCSPYLSSSGCTVAHVQCLCKPLRPSKAHNHLQPPPGSIKFHMPSPPQAGAATPQRTAMCQYLSPLATPRWTRATTRRTTVATQPHSSPASAHLGCLSTSGLPRGWRSRTRCQPDTAHRDS